MCDFGINFVEQVVLQAESQIYPRLISDGDALHPRQNSASALFDFNTFPSAATLPDQYHIPFLIRLPPGLPSSFFMKGYESMGASATRANAWGLTYYAYAYVISLDAPKGAVHHEPAKDDVGVGWNGPSAAAAGPQTRPRPPIFDVEAGSKLFGGRRDLRQHKVFLSFSKTTVGSYARIARSIGVPPTDSSKRSAFLGLREPLHLTASLDRVAYYAGEPIGIHVKMRNLGQQEVPGLRITIKQVRCAAS